MKPSARMSPSSPLPAWRTHIVTTFQALRERQRTPVEWAYLILWIFYLVSYPIAVTGVAFDVRPGFSMAWAGSVLLFVQGALAVLWLILSLGTLRGGQLALLVALGALFGETLGVATGFPFGGYHYAHILFPRLPGSVPLPVLGAWLLVVATSVGIARWLAPGGAEARGRQIALAMVLGVALDLVLEPVAVTVEHYWIWHGTGPYYGIPTTNFLGWAALCALLAGAVIVMWDSRSQRGEDGEDAEQPRSGQRPGQPQGIAPTHPHLAIPSLADSMLWLYMLTMFMFAFIDLTHGLWLAAFAGAALLALLALRRFRNV